MQVTIRSNNPTNERWIIGENGKPERWFVDKESDEYVTLRKTREPLPQVRRVTIPREKAFLTEAECRINVPKM